MFDAIGSTKITIRASNITITDAAANIVVFLNMEDKKNDIEMVEKQPQNAWINIIRGSMRKNVEICSIPAPSSKSKPYVHKVSIKEYARAEIQYYNVVTPFKYRDFLIPVYLSSTMWLPYF